MDNAEPLSPKNTPDEFTPEELALKNKITSLKDDAGIFIENLSTRKHSKLDLIEQLSNVCASMKKLLREYNERYPSSFAYFNNKLDYMNSGYQSILLLLSEKKKTGQITLTPQETANIIGKCQSLQSMFADIHPNLGRSSPRPLRKSLENAVEKGYKAARATADELEKTMYFKNEGAKAENNVAPSPAPTNRSIKVFS